MSIESIYAEVAIAVERRRGQPEGQSFIALAADEAVARELGPELMRRQDPSREWGDVLHVETLGDGTIEVVVEDRGPVAQKGSK